MISRRNFIKVTGVIGGGLLLKFNTATGSAMSLSSGQSLGNFLRITPDGEIFFQFVKHEMGQGVSTALAQVICEELCADWNKVRIEFPMADMKKYQNDQNGGHDTGGSCTLIYQWDLLRNAGATARQMLVQAAARQWNTSPENCYAENGWVFRRSSADKLAFGDLASSAAKVPVPEKVKLKGNEEYKIIGKPTHGRLTQAIVTGELKYGIDVKVPGLMYAVIERCPVFRGKLKHFDATKALKIPGVKKVFSTQPIAGLQSGGLYMAHDIRDGVAVVADSFWAAENGRAALTIEWDEGPNRLLSSEDFEKVAEKRALHRTDPTGFIGDENAVSDLNHVRKTLRASYVFPQQLHSCMEPGNCTAHCHEDSCEIWLGSQVPNLISDDISRLFGYKQENIKIQLFPSGGGFGRRAYPDMAIEAAFISKTAGNIPVKMLWTREDEHKANLAHMFQHMEFQGALDENNQLYAWYEKEIRTYNWAAKYADPQHPNMVYDIPNIRLDFEDMSREELYHSSAWRGVVVHGKALAECFIDEIAAALKIDPLQFRMSMLQKDRIVFAGEGNTLSSARLRGVLKLAAEKSGYGKSMEAGRGMGIAVCPYGGSYCAVVAEITVREGKVLIDNITIAVDCGKVVNPSGVETQMVGGVVWSLTALFYGGLPIKNGRALHTNFHQNKILRMNECPPMQVHFVETSEERPGGVGEISSPLGVPAVLNAIYAATGKRIRRIPINAEELRS